MSPRCDEIGVARDIARRLFELRLVLGELRLGALQLGLGLAGVELEQHVAGLDRRAVGDQHLVDRRVEMRAQGHGGDRLRRADRIDAPGKILARAVADDDGHRRARSRRGCWATATAGPPAAWQKTVQPPGERAAQGERDWIVRVEAA